MPRGRDYAQQKPLAPATKPRSKAKGKAAPSRHAVRGSSTALPVWAWMLMGISLLLLVAVIYTIARPTAPMQFSPSSEATHKDGKKVVIPPREKPTYDFYAMLPNEQVDATPRRSDGTEARPPPEQAPTPPPEVLAAVEPPPPPPIPEPRPEPLPEPKPVPKPEPKPVEPKPEPKPQAKVAEPKPEPKAEPVKPKPEPKPATKPEPSKPVQSASASSGRYLIQTAAYRTRDDAENSRAALALAGFTARIEAAEVNGATWHRVRLGPFASREAAQGVQARLAGNGLKGVLLPAGK